MSQIVAAVVGTGFIGPVHVEGLKRAGITVRGILGTSPQKSKVAANALGLDIGYESFEALLADSLVHSVHLTSPNRFHFEQALACFRAGKHVLCEKPLAMNSKESSELCAAARSSGLAAGVNYNVRYYPLCIEAAERIRQGQLGKVYHVTGSYVQDWLHRDTDFNWRVLASEGGALRAMADIGTHWLDLLSFITQLEIQAVCADLQTVHPIRRKSKGTTETFTGKLSVPHETDDVAIDTEDYGSVLLRFASGAHGSMHVSQVTAGHKNCIRYEIAGSEESLAWNSQLPNQMWIGHRDAPNQELLRDPALLSLAARRHADYPGGHNEGFPDTFKQLCRDFYGYIAAGDFHAAPTFPSFADGHREIVLCEAILESARTQRWVTVPNCAG